jgi:hypothetical protein
VQQKTGTPPPEPNYTMYLFIYSSARHLYINLQTQLASILAAAACWQQNTYSHKYTATYTKLEINALHSHIHWERFNARVALESNESSRKVRVAQHTQKPVLLLLQQYVHTHHCICCNYAGSPLVSQGNNNNLAFGTLKKSPAHAPRRQQQSPRVGRKINNLHSALLQEEEEKNVKKDVAFAPSWRMYVCVCIFVFLRGIGFDYCCC